MCFSFIVSLISLLINLLIQKTKKIKVLHLYLTNYEKHITILKVREEKL